MQLCYQYAEPFPPAEMKELEIETSHYSFLRFQEHKALLQQLVSGKQQPEPANIPLADRAKRQTAELEEEMQEMRKRHRALLGIVTTVTNAN
jgi:hypothetical protein